MLASRVKQRVQQPHLQGVACRGLGEGVHLAEVQQRPRPCFCILQWQQQLSGGCIVQRQGLLAFDMARAAPFDGCV